MSTRPIVSKLDSERLEPFLLHSWIDAPVLRLRTLLERARKVAPPRVPPDVVTMNSRVRVRYPGEEESEALDLTFPDAGGLSVLSPLGAALLGAARRSRGRERAVRGRPRVQTRDGRADRVPAGA